MNSNNKKGFVLSRTFLIVIMLLIVVVGGTVAWFSYASKQSALVLTIGDINDTHIILTPYQIKGTMTPVETYTSGVYSEVEVINDDTDSTSISLFYKINELDQKLIDNGLKYTIASSDSENGTYTEIKTGDFTQFSGQDEALILDTNTQADTTIYYRVYLWLDSEVGEQSIVQGSVLDVELNASIAQRATNPVLSDGMIPVVISDNGDVKTIASTDDNWYDYSSQKWANVVLVNSSSRSSYEDTTGKTVNQSDILAYYVWIPRFRYKIWTTGVSSAGFEDRIDVVFEGFNDSMSLGTTVGSYRTHPAFWFDGDNDGTVDNGETLAGIWVGKFETTGSVDTPTILPGVAPLHSQNVSSLFNVSLKFSNGSLNTSTGKVTFPGGSNGYTIPGTTYGLGIEVDSHMAKNSEWGAVAYLAHSRFGINKEVESNYFTSLMTGCGISDGGTSCLNKYGSGISEYTQSTTGNITGVFDLSGGTYEYVMGNFDGQKGSSGFSVLPESKYYNLYSSLTFTGDATTNVDYCTIDTCGGHAISETYGWYGDNKKFVTSDKPWFIRGGDNTGGSRVGMFAVNNANGNADNEYSMRSILVNLPSYTITYNMNDGFGSVANQTKIYGVDLTLSDIIPSRVGYKFLGWGTSAAATTATYQPGGTYTGNTGITLYAVWQANTYTISYDYTGGTVTTANPTGYNAGTNTITLNNPSRTGYTFTGYTEKISTSNWYDGYIDLNTGVIRSYNSEYPNSVYSELIYVENGVTYTLSGTNLGNVRWMFYNTSGTFVSNTSDKTFTPNQNGYVRILLYDGCTETNRNTAVITSNQGTSVSIVKGSTGNRNYVASWSANPLTFNNQTFTVEYNGSQQTATFVGASNGTGSYSYQISGTGSSYFSIDGSNLVISASAPANTYTLTVKATDNNSAVTKSVTFTVTINKKTVAIVWDSTTEWEYDGLSHVPTASVTTGINGETMTLNVAGAQINAGSYTATASCESVSGGQANCNNYTLTNTTKSFKIIGKPNQITGTNSSMYVQGTLDISTLISNAKGTLSYEIKSQTTTGSSMNSKNLTTGVLSSSNDNDGTVVVTVTDDGGGNYEPSSVDVTVTIQKYTRTLTWTSTTPTSVTYGDNSKKATVSLSGTGGTAGAVTYSSGSTSNLTINSSTGALTPVTYSTGVTITASMARTTTVKAASVTKSIAVARATGYVNLSSTSNTVAYGTTSKTVTITNHHGGTLSVSDNNNTASSSVSGTTVTIGSLGSIAAGTTITVTVTSAQTNQYNSASATYTLLIDYITLTTSQIIVTPYSGAYDGSAHYATIKSTIAGLKIVSGTTTSYGTTVASSTTANTSYNLSPSRTDVGTTTIYYKVTGTGYNDYTGSTTVTISNGTLSGSVNITGTNKVGSTLTANVTNTDNATLKYQWWYSSSSTATSGTNISGATSSTYSPTATYIGKYIGVTVTASKTNYNTATWKDITDTSNTYAPVQGVITGSVEITGSNVVNQTLTASVTVNPSNASLTYQWWTLTTSSWGSGTKTNISGATSSTYKLTSSEVGKTIGVTVSASKTSYDSASFDDQTDATKNTSATVLDIYTITYDACSGSGAPASATKTHGLDFTLSSTVPTRSGYNFLGWALKSTTVSSCSAATSKTHDPGGTYTSNADATFYAVWEDASHTVTYVGNMFSSWATNRAFTPSGSSTSLTLSYDISTSTLTLNGPVVSGLMLGFTETSFTSGEKYDIKFEYVSGSISNASGYNFVSEVYNSNMKQLTSRNYVNSTFPTSGNSSSTLTISSSAASSGKFLHFRFYKTSSSSASFNNYKVKVIVTKQSTATVTTGGKYTLPSNPVRNGYTFKGWYTAESGGTKVTNTTTVTATSDHNLYAQWTAKTLKVNYDANGGTGTMTATSYTFANATEWSLKANTFTRDGYEFYRFGFYNPTLDLWFGCTDSNTCSGGGNVTIGWWKSSDIVNYYYRGDTVSLSTSNAMGYDINAVAQWKELT